MKKFLKVSASDYLAVSAIRIFRIFYEQVGELRTKEETLRDPSHGQQCVLIITDTSGEKFTLRGRHAEAAVHMLTEEALTW